MKSFFKEGVMVAKNDVHMPKHPELADKNMPNLHVMKAKQSLNSRGYVKEQFAWRHFYWYLTKDGIRISGITCTYLRRSRPPPCVTALPRPTGLRPEVQRVSSSLQDSQEGRQTERDTYRRSAVPPGADKKAEAGLAQQQNSSLEGVLVVDVVSHLSEVGDYVVLNKL